MARRTWVQDPNTGKLIPKEEYRREDRSGVFIQGDIDSFVSPVDGSVISDRSHLRRHNAKHGVTDSRDYSADYLEKKARERNDRSHGRTREDRAERRELIIRALEGK